MKNLTKKKIITTITLAVTVALGLIAILTALRLYQLRQQAVAPTAPESKPKAASPAVVPLKFTISSAKPTITPTAKPIPTAIPTIKPTATPNPNKTESQTPAGTGLAAPLTVTPTPLTANLEELTPTSAQRSLFTDFRIFLPILVAIGSGIILIFISSIL